LNPQDRIFNQLQFLYGNEADQIWPDLDQILDSFRSRNPNSLKGGFQLDQNDIILITYGDQFNELGRRPLQSLYDFLDKYLIDVINSVHILPFYPFSSDDGFSVIDYRQVNPDYGTWEDIAKLADKFQLMFDAVINHISRRSSWFKSFLLQEPPYKDYFITIDPGTDLSSVFRPRALPLLTRVDTSSGKMLVWTTFSDDQIDLNYSNPKVLLEIIELLLFYIEHGARLIRLDAIGYAWKEVGTSSLNLPQAHSMVKLLRAVIDDVAPGVGLITETNVPHEENIKYFGAPISESGDSDSPYIGDEAQLIYQFSLAPLILHTFSCGNVTALSAWARNLSVPYHNSSFFNFIASHDGIGVMPAKGLLTEDEIQTLIDQTIHHGGEVSYKTNSDGTKSVYELNITLFDALNNPSEPDPELDIKRFLASQAIMLSLAGVPGIYVHSLFGSHNCHQCVEETTRARSINREKFTLDKLQSTLVDPENLHTRIFQGYKHLLRIRRVIPAFHPNGPQTILEIDPHVFALLRTDPNLNEHIFCLINVTPEKQTVAIDLEIVNLLDASSIRDLVDNKEYTNDSNHLNLSLDGYQVMWLTGS
jgi:glycosidase